MFPNIHGELLVKKSSISGFNARERSLELWWKRFSKIQNWKYYEDFCQMLEKLAGSIRVTQYAISRHPKSWK